jgi:type II secretory pathway pseudopilin PulG
MRFAICDLRLGRQPCRPQTGRSGLRAFTLIETVGVLAVLSILAAILAPAVIRRIDQAARVRDAAELNGMAVALNSVIQRTGQIPGASTLISVLANEMAVSPNQIATNSRQVARAFLIDPNLWIGSGNGKLPYIQTNFPPGTGTHSGGVAVPGLNLRLIIISSLTQPLPDPATIDFTNTWGTPDGAIPSKLSWAGFPDDLKIQRVDFTPLFKRVILNPIDTNTNYGSFAIESGQGASSINPVTQVLTNSWYLQGTALRLYDTNAGLVMEMKTVIQKDTSYVFENQLWRGQLSGWGTYGPMPSPSSTVDLFGILANMMSMEPNLKVNTSPGTLLLDFYSFMGDYNAWTQSGDPTLLQELTGVLKKGLPLGPPGLQQQIQTATGELSQ